MTTVRQDKGFPVGAPITLDATTGIGVFPRTAAVRALFVPARASL